MNKLSLLILTLLLVNNCSINKKQGLWGKEKSNIKNIENIKTILTKQSREVKEFNPKLEIKISKGEFNKNFQNNQNDFGELSYEGELEKIGKYKFSKFDDFDYIDVRPVFYNEHTLFFDNKGTIILYDQNQKVIWKKNNYSKNEKKLKPRLNFAISKNFLIVTDNIAKYYLIDIETGDIIWSKNNSVPFNSNIKVKDNIFYAVDYKNILRAILIKDGSELWNLKTEESLTKSNTKISIAIEKESIYFNNTIGDITAVNIKSGQLIWQLPTQNNNTTKSAFQLSYSEIVINAQTIFFSNNKNEFYSLDTTTGLINWKNEINSNLKPVIIGEFIITVSQKGYLYIVDKQTGSIIRINNLHQNYKIKKRNRVSTTGFFVAQNKIYLSNNDGKLIIANLNTGNILNTKKISNNKILQPYLNNNHLFIIKNGAIIKFN